MFEKALGLVPDAFVPDLEDSVPAAEKDRARDTTVSYLPRLASTGVKVIPRVNPEDTGRLEDDLAAVVGPYTYGVSVGKVGDADDVRRAAGMLDEIEGRAGLETGHTRLVVWVETALAVVNAYQVAAASPRVVAVAFGAEDFTNDMGIERSEAGSEVAYPRAAVCVAAQAAEVLALDTPYFGFRDPEGLQRDIVASRRLGFRGKFAIHPDQITTINEGFGPTTAEVENARRVVAAFEEAERAGRGSTSLDGQVVDVPVVKRARSLLETASRLAAPGGRA